MKLAHARMQRYDVGDVQQVEALLDSLDHRETVGCAPL